MPPLIRRGAGDPGRWGVGKGRIPALAVRVARHAAHEILSGNAMAGEKGNNRPHALTKHLGPTGRAAVALGTQIIACITDALGLPRRPPLEGVGCSEYATALHVDCSSGAHMHDTCALYL